MSDIILRLLVGAKAQQLTKMTMVIIIDILFKLKNIEFLNYPLLELFRIGQNQCGFEENLEHNHFKHRMRQVYRCHQHHTEYVVLCGEL